MAEADAGELDVSVSVGPVAGLMPPGGAVAPEVGGGSLTFDAAEPREPLDQCSSETDAVGIIVAETAAELRAVLEAGDQPSLVAQLMALTVSQLKKRLETLQRPALQPQRKAELVNGLCEAYADMAGKGQPRIVQRSEGQLMPEAAVAELLETLRMVDWKENRRPGVQSDGYIILKRPCALGARDHRAEAKGPRWSERDPRTVRRKLWELGEALLAGSAKSRAFDFTNIVVSRNFVGSPHTDSNDLSVQYLLSLGDFVGGGELCVEESAFVVRSLNTKGRLACIDGRFPHWVSGYTGERFSVVFYRSVGCLEPVSHAVHDV